MANHSGLAHAVIRWPFLLFIGCIIVLELFMYICIRYFVVAWEYTFTWRRKMKSPRVQLVKAETYDEWKQAAITLDKLLKGDVWRATLEDSPPLYDYNLILNVRNQLDKYISSAQLSKSDVFKIMETLEVACNSNFGGIENEHLYSYTFWGTKVVLEEYINLVSRSLNRVAVVPDLTINEKLAFFKKVAKGYGKTALCLSGGATFGFYHLGVIKTLLAHKCLPTVISGTSMGALVAAMVCVRTDEELEAILDASLSTHAKSTDDTRWQMFMRFMREGVLYDAIAWMKKIQWFTMGNMTFLEAYKRTGRILNISAVPQEQHSPPHLLNYLNAPHVVISSAVIASAAVPGLVNAVELHYKTEDGVVLPYHSIGERWRDGSLKTDIPTSTLHAFFNVNFTIVSQVNPHIVPFFFYHRGSSGSPSPHRSGRGWRGGFLASTLEHLLKLDMMKWLRLLRDLDLLPAVLGQDWSFVFLQKFYGNVTIVPKVPLSSYTKLISDPSPKDIEHYLLRGEQATWPRLAMIQNRMKVERSINECRRTLTSLKQSKKDTNWRTHSTF